MNTVFKWIQFLNEYNNIQINNVFVLFLMYMCNFDFPVQAPET